MNFGEALEQLKAGHKVQRVGWNGAGMHLAIQFCDEHSKMTHSYFIIITIPECKEGTRLLPWQPSQVDLLADDWNIVD